MSFETDLIDKYGAIFGGRLWHDTAPDDFNPNAAPDVFCIMQQVGGTDRWYVDNTLPGMQNARMQFFVWGPRRIEVSDAARALRKAVADSIAINWVTSPLGAAVNDYNEVLKLRGARQDFGFWYPDPLAVD
jgi:Protein of unknown function (DUF3168).